MLFTWRAERQATTLAIIVLLVLAIAGWFAYQFYPAATCNDNKKNQGETEIDCGGPCIPCALKHPKPVSLVWARIIPVRENIYDVVAQIHNPNELLGAGNLEYQFTLFDQSGQPLVEKSGKTFIFPQEDIHVIETGLTTLQKPVRVEFRVNNADWHVAEGEEIPNVVVERHEYSVAKNGDRRESQVEASIVNKTSFDYKEFEVNVIVLDDQKNALGVNRMHVDGLAAHSRKTVVSLWPRELAGTVDAVLVEPRVNTFNPDIIQKPN